MSRLDNLTPNTPKVGSANKFNKRKPQETPSVSRLKTEPGSSPPTFKTPYKPGEKTGVPYATKYRCTNKANEIAERLSTTD